MLETLEREIRAASNSIRNDLSTRVNHPSYGVTKTKMWGTFHRLEGMVIAHRIMSDPDCPPNPSAVVDPYARERLGVDLHDLHIKISNA